MCFLQIICISRARLKAKFYILISTCSKIRTLKTLAVLQMHGNLFSVNH